MKQLIFILIAIIGVSQAQTIQYIGAPTTTVISRGNFRTDSIFYLPKRTKLPTDTAALRYQISDSSLYAWTGSQWRKVGADADTLVYSTRAWRQKGDDSLAARINLKVNISDTTSMLTPYLRKADTTAMLSPYYRSATASAALALKLNISDTSTMLTPYIRHAGYGLTKSSQSFLVDTLNIATRAWRQKGLDSLAALEVSGSGTTNYVPKFTAGSTIGNSVIYNAGGLVGINTASPVEMLSLSGGVGNTFGISLNPSGWNNAKHRYSVPSSGDEGFLSYNYNGSAVDFASYATSSIAVGNGVLRFSTGGTNAAPSERMRIFANGRIGINTTTDAGYQLDVNGTLRSVNGANFATSSGNVLIGTATASSVSTARLSILGSGVQDSYIQVMNGAGGGFLMGSLNGTGMQLYTLTGVQGAEAGTKRLEVNSNGELIIGTGASDAGDYKLQVSGSSRLYHPTANIGGLLTSFNGNSENYYDADLHTFRFGNGGGPAMVIRSNAEVAINNPADAGDYKLQVAGNIYNTGSAVLAATGGDVLIRGTNNPLTATNRGNITLNGTASNIVAFTNGSTATGYLFQSTADMQLFNNTATGNLSFYTNAALVGRFTPSGEFLINTDGTDAGDYKLQVSGNVLTNFIYTRNNTDGLIFGTNSAVNPYIQGTSGNALVLGTSNNPRVWVTSGGNVGIGTASPAQKLDVSGVIRANSGTIYAQASGTESSGYQLNAITLGYDATNTIGWITAGGAAARTNLVLQQSGGEVLIGTSSDAGDYKLQVSGNIYNTGSAVLAATSGEVLVGTTTDRGAYKFQADGLSFFGSDANSYALLNNTASNAAMQAYGAWTNHLRMTYPAVVDFDFQVTASGELDLKRSSTVATRVNAAREFMINTTTDAGDYHLQVVGNARIGTGKLDIASNTTFGIGVARSGTSEVAGQIYNSNGILYTGVESSAGGQIFSGSSAYAAVIGSGANYPLQFATNNATRATITSSGKFIVGATSEYFFSSKMEVNGGMAIRNTPTDGYLFLDSTAVILYGITNRVGFNMNNGKLTGNNASPAFTIYDWTWNTAANVNLIDISLVNTASGASSNYFRISDGTNEFRVTKAAEVVTAAPTGGSVRKWKLGEAATVSPTSPNRTIRIEIDGTVYYLHAKTTND